MCGPYTHTAVRALAYPIPTIKMTAVRFVCYHQIVIMYAITLSR